MTLFLPDNATAGSGRQLLRAWIDGFANQSAFLTSPSIDNGCPRPVHGGYAKSSLLPPATLRSQHICIQV
jgi:hypothetical protein